MNLILKCLFKDFKRIPSLNTSDSEKITLSWDNLNVHMPKETGFFAKLFKKKVTNTRSHIVQNG